MLCKTKAIAALLAAAAIGGGAQAATDPVGDFLATFTGAQAASLDFTSAEARFDGTKFDLKLTLAGSAAGAPAGQLWVWGVNRGAGTPRLNELFDPDIEPVKWDALAVLAPNGALSVVALQPAGPPAFTFIPGGAVIDGNSITASVPLSLWGSRGYAPISYTFQLWSRLRTNPAMDGPNDEIADFGPRVFAAVPEPASWAMMIAGFACAGAAARRRRRAAFA
ncbi:MULTISPECIES: PEPxxWA-CTERM sorting domain-containing protein [Sphingomonas]|uniref:PEPxxWA-CTERM sorting domain-containing protein n=1 Tax=Sphingomonas TaxID=13687 RepID=UPI001E53D766|nr:MULTISPECIES: PEPxxWA-CTERM sorting domain-containing protein [Sphingomonas]